MRCANGHFHDPSDQSGAIDGVCPQCGTAYPDQPSPIHSEMETRNMPAPGEEDQGGNPLKEGILADNGWQSQDRRDESFASVRKAYQDNIVERQEAHIPWHMAADFEIEQVVEPGPHTVEVDAPDQPIILQHSDAGVLDAAKSQLTANALGLGGGMAGGAAGAAAGLALAPETGGLSLIAAPLIGRAVGGIMGHALGNGLGNAIGLGGQTPTQAPVPQQEEFRGIDQLSHIVGGFGDTSPTSQDHIPSDDTSDPEKVDPHEKNDDDNDTWQKDLSVDGTGGADSAHPFDENGGGLEAARLLLPLLVHHFQNGTGGDDPLMHALDGMLESEAPGYKDAEPDHGAIEELLAAFKGDKRDEGAPTVKDEAGDSGQSDDFNGNDIDKQSRVASGPRTPEQFKAVGDLLQQSGRGDELPNLLNDPDQYEQELAEVQNREPVNPAEVPGTPPPPPQPAQEETPPGAGMPMPAPPTGLQPMAAIIEAADALAPICPKCDSHTTGLVDADGACHCHSCGHDFSTGATAVDNKTARWHVAAHPYEHGIPAADQQQAEDPTRELDTGLSWQDVSGEPLKVGQEYEMYSQRYAVPDLIRITDVKPDAIDYELTGEYGLDSSAEITRQDADLYQYTFKPSSGLQDAPEINATPVADPNAGFGGVASPAAPTDAPDGQRGAGFQQGIVRRGGTVVMPEEGQAHGDPDLDWLREGGAHFTLSEQRDFVEESGIARNSDKLDLANTHYQSRPDTDDEHFLFGL